MPEISRSTGEREWVMDTSQPIRLQTLMIDANGSISAIVQCFNQSYGWRDVSFISSMTEQSGYISVMITPTAGGAA